MLPKQEYLGLLITVARRRIKQAVLSRLLPFRLGSQQFWVLLAIRAHPGASFGELAERQGLDAPTASRVIAGLHQRRLVRLELDPVDRRRSQIALSKSGEALASKLQPIANGVRAAIIEGMSAQEQEALRASLRKVMASLARFESSPVKKPRAGSHGARPQSSRGSARKVLP